MRKLVSWMIPVRYIRTWMTESSNTCDTHGSADKRNCVGYAINELYVGALSADGQFNDHVTHFPSRDQTVTWPSSVDPWHAATDLDQSRGDFVGFDFFFSCGITRGLPTWFRLPCCIPRQKMRRMKSLMGTTDFRTPSSIDAKHLRRTPTNSRTALT